MAGSWTYISQVKQVVGIEHNREDGEGDLQDGKLEGAQFEQEERASGFRTEAVMNVMRKKGGLKRNTKSEGQQRSFEGAWPRVTSSSINPPPRCCCAAVRRKPAAWNDLLLGKSPYMVPRMDLRTFEIPFLY